MTSTDLVPMRPLELPAARSDAAVGLMSSLRRQLPVFIIVSVAIMLASAAFTLTRIPQFTTAASLMLAPTRAEVGQDRATLSDPTTDASVDSEVEVLKSRTLAETVVDRLHLATDPRFSPTYKPRNLLERWLPFLPAPGANIAPRAGQWREAAIQTVQNHLTVKRVAQTFALDVTYSAPSPSLAALVANAYVDAYVQQSLDLKLQSARTVNGLLSSQLDKLRGQVEAAEDAVGEYKNAHNLVDVDGSTAVEQEIVALDQQVAAARASQAEAVARLTTARHQLAAGSNGQDVGEALSSPVVQDLRRQRATISSHLADLQQKYGPRYPEIIQAQGQLADLDGQISAEIQRIISNVDANSQIAERRTNSLGSSLAGAKATLASQSVASVKLNELQRSADSARALYEGVLGRAKETATQEATSQPDARVMSYATDANAGRSPNLVVSMAVGLLLAIGCGVAAGALRQELDTGLGTLEDVEDRLGTPYFVGIPALPYALLQRNNRTLSETLRQAPFSSLAEAYRALAMMMLNMRRSGSGTVIAITSALPKEGKTTTAIILARTLSAMHMRVVLVDCDLRRPSIAGHCGLEPQYDLLDVISEHVELDDALLVEAGSGVTVLASNRRSFDDGSPFASQRMKAMLTELRQRFDLVLLDTSPILPVIDSRLVAKLADKVVLLIQWRKTPEKAARLSIHMLRSLGVKIAGIALTKVDLRVQAHSGYGDPAFYYNQYKAYQLD